MAEGQARDDAVAKWLSAALNDLEVCEEMKADIRTWFDSHSTSALTSALAAEREPKP